MTTQPKARELADACDDIADHDDAGRVEELRESAAELRRQHAEIERLTAELQVSDAASGIALNEVRRLEAVNAGLLEALQWIELVFTDESMAQEREAELWLPMVRAAIERAEGGKG